MNTLVSLRKRSIGLRSILQVSDYFENWLLGFDKTAFEHGFGGERLDCFCDSSTWVLICYTESDAPLSKHTECPTIATNPISTPLTYPL